jgi:hypothetical protein
VQITTCTYIPEKKEHSGQMFAGTGERMKDGVVPGRVILLFWGMVLLTVLFTGLIFFIPLDTYHLYSNLFEVVIALVCMVSCLYAYRTWSERIILLLAAFAFGGFALSNTFWYLYLTAFQLSRDSVFFTISEMGFLGFMLFFIVAFRIEFPQKPCPLLSRAAMAGLLLMTAVVLLKLSGITPDTGLLKSHLEIVALLLLRLLVLLLFIDAALCYGVYQYPLLWPGIWIWSFASVLYGFREVVVVQFDVKLVTTNPFWSLVGPLDILSFLFIQLGLFTYLNSRQD